MLLVKCGLIPFGAGYAMLGFMTVNF